MRRFILLSSLVLPVACAAPLSDPVSEGDASPGVPRSQEPLLSEPVSVPALGEGALSIAAGGLRLRTSRVEVGLRVVAVGRGDSPAEVRGVAPRRRGQRWEYARDGHVEWFELLPRGLEHGLDISRRPAGDGPLEVRVRFEHLEPQVAARIVRLLDEHGTERVRYEQLVVVDARGHRLPARFAARGPGTLAILVHDLDAVYPITVDPILWDATTLDGSPLESCAGLGGAVALAARSDLLVLGAPRACVDGAARGGMLAFDRIGERWAPRAFVPRAGGAEGDGFGSRLAASPEWVAAAAPGADAVELFARVGPRLVSAATVTLRTDAPVGADSPEFGASLGLAPEVLVVGAPGLAPGGAEGAGLVYVHRPEEEGVWRSRQTLGLESPVARQGFGLDLALAGAELAVLSAQGVHLFTEVPGGGRFLASGEIRVADPKHITYDGERLVVRRSGGEVRIYERSGDGSFAMSATLTPSAGRHLLAVDGDRVAVDQEGDVRTYALVAGTWVDEGLVEGAPSDAVALGLVGAQVITLDGAGVVSVFRRVSTTGTACVEGRECQTGLCVDGVCCESACGGDAADCQACSVAAGSSADGSCEAAVGGTVCRSTVGACDVVEACDGASFSCPADLLSPPGASCRPATGPCDVADVCSGLSPFCPRNRVKPVGEACRPAAGDCDVAERCDGIRTVCPSDRVSPEGDVCRSLAGPCDAEETCDGVAPRCPLDGFEPFSTICRPSAAPCDAAERCSGSSPSCPSDIFDADGTPCRDGDACTLNDACRAGRCEPGPMMCEPPPTIEDPEPPLPGSGGGCAVASPPGSANWALLGLAVLALRRREVL